MRIAVVSDVSGISGVADYKRLLASALHERGHEIVSETDAADIAIYNYAPYAAGVGLGWWRGVRTAHRLRRRARHVVIVFHEVFARPDDRVRMRVFGAMQRWSTRRLDAVASATVVADEARARRLAALAPGTAAPAVIPVGPNIPVPAEPRRGATPSVLLFGLLHPDRDLETVIRAVALLRESIPDVRLRVVGDLSDDPIRRDRLAGLIDELRAPATLDGALDVAAVAIAFADARVFVSTYSSNVSLGSGTIATALAYALPVVVYDSARLHPALVPGQTILTAPRESSALATVVTEALGPMGDTVGREGRHLYERELAWPTIAARFEVLLQGLR